jgi:hypothetical protein
MRTCRLGHRITLIAGLIATASFVSSEILIRNDRAEAAAPQVTVGDRQQDTWARAKSKPGKPAVTTTTTTTPVTAATTPVTTTTTPATTTTTTTTTTLLPSIATVPPPDAALSLSFLPSAGSAGWGMEVSDDRQSLTNDGTRVTCAIGGFEASTHYARLRRKLPETDDFAPRGPFSIGADIELPEDFYSRSESYVRFITTDNYPGTMRGSGEKVGASSGDEWRVGFLIYGSDQLPRLVSEHENRETIVLWKGTSRLPTGRNDIGIDFTPSQGPDGAFEISINGAVVASVAGVRTVPTSLSPAEVVVTRVGSCLDGASKQDTQRLTTHVRAFSFVAQW